MRQIKVYLVYRHSQRHMGSTIMRALQMRRIVDAFGSGRVKTGLMTISNMRLEAVERAWCATRPRDAVYVFCKDAIDKLSPGARALLSERTRGVAVDYIDKDLDGFDFTAIDGHIASSARQFDYLAGHAAPGSQAHLLPHQADLRLATLRPVQEPSWRPVYFGEPDNLFIPGHLRERVDVYPYERKLDASDIAAISRHPWQYGVRPSGQNSAATVFKPATKIVNAAFFRAPPVVGRDADDALTLLGADYPYLVDTTAPESFDCVFDAIQSGTQSPEYARALDRLAHIRETHGFSQTARCFEEICLALYERRGS